MPRRAGQTLHKGGLTANYYTTSRHNVHPVAKKVLNSKDKKRLESKTINVMNKKVKYGKIKKLKYDI